MENNNSLKNEYCIIIPTFNPTNDFLSFVNGLIMSGFNKIIIVNDGSDKVYNHIFEELNNIDGVIILTHIVNMGKGRAIKNALNYYMLNLKNDFSGVITVDSDIMQIVDDIKKLKNKSIKYNNSFVIGKRDFYKKNISFLTYLNSFISKIIFKIFVGGNISDIRSGLRVIPNDLIDESLKIRGEKYDFEVNQLIYLIQHKKQLFETYVHTNNNPNSYFKPIVDNMIIYYLIFSTFLKYSMTSMISFGVDYIIYCFLCLSLKFNSDYYRIFISSLIARIISSYVNYNLTKNIAFDNKTKNISSLIKYYIICFVQLLISSNLVILVVNKTTTSEYSAKIMIDLILFFVSYLIQKKFVFNNE